MKNLSISRGHTWSVRLLAFLIPLSTAGTHIALSALLLTWFFTRSVHRKVSVILKDPLCQAIGLFIGVYLFSLCYTSASVEEARQTLSKMSKWLFFPFIWSAIANKEESYTCLNIFIASVLFSVFVGGLQFLVGPFGRFQLGVAFKDPIFTSLMVAWSLFVILHLQRLLAFRDRIGYLLSGVYLCLYLFFLSTGRSGQIIGILLASLFAWQIKRWKGIFSMGAIFSVIFGIAVLSHSSFYQRLDSIRQEYSGETMGNRSIHERIVYAKETWKLAVQKPWLGYGVGSLQGKLGKRFEALSLPVANNPHNEYLNVFFQLGIPGILTLLYLFLAIYRQSRRVDKTHRYLAQGLLLTLVVGCFGNSWLMDFTSGYFFIMMLAIVFSTDFAKVRDSYA